MPIQTCGQSVSARRGERYTEIGLLGSPRRVTLMRRSSHHKPSSRVYMTIHPGGEWCSMLRSSCRSQYKCTLQFTFRARYAPSLFRRFRALYEANFGNSWRFCSILGNFSVGTLPKHTQFPSSWVGTEHDFKSVLVPSLPGPLAASAPPGTNPLGGHRWTSLRDLIPRDDR